MTKIGFALSFIILASCAAGASQYQINSAMEKANKSAANCGLTAMSSDVASAWETVARINEKECPYGTKDKPLPLEKVDEASKCYGELVATHVKPVTSNKKALEKLLAQQEKIKEAYKAKTVDRDTANMRKEQSFNEYAVAEMSFFKLMQCQNAAMMQHVMPVYHNKAALASFLAERSEIALKVDEGKLTPQQGDIAVQKALASFADAEQRGNAALHAQSAQAWRDYSRQLQQFSTQMQQNSGTGGECGSISIAPIASAGCENVCINGRWAEVCG